MIPDKRGSGEAPCGFEAALEARTEQQLISGHDWLAKTSLIQTHKIEGCSRLRNHAGSHEGKYASGLSQRFDDYHAGHERTGRKMSRKKRLVVGHVLHRSDTFSGVNFEHSVDEKKGVAVWKLLKD
jgi:hypothetical protein